MSQTVSPSAGRPYGLARTCRALEVARSTVYAARARRAPAADPPEARPEDGVDGRRADGAHPPEPGRVAVPGRGLPQGLGAPAAGRRPHQQSARPAAHARGGLLAPTRAGTPHGPRRTTGPSSRNARRDVGNRRHLLPHRRGHGHHLPRGRPLHRRVRGHPRRPRRHAVRGAGAAAPGSAPALRRPTRPAPRRPGPAARPRQPLHERPVPGRAPLPGHRQQPGLRPASRRATAAPSASSAPSRSSCCGWSASPPSRPYAWRCSPSRSATTALGSSGATATAAPPRSASASRRPPPR